ncbi:MAG: hypothetical protein OCD02_13985 [Spirochaetaceae bacterium]
MNEKEIMETGSESKVISRKEALKRISKIGLGIGAAVVATSCDLYYYDYTYSDYSDYYYSYYVYTNYYW